MQIFDYNMLSVLMGWMYGAMREPQNGFRKDTVWWKNLIFGLCVSLAIELPQVIFKLSFFEFYNILNNTIGIMVGYGLLRFLERKYKCNT